MSRPLDDKVKELATNNWQKFVEIAGDDFIFMFKARLLRKEGKSWAQISIILDTTVSKIRTACKTTF